ncbi:MAG: PRC-barrel domain-containing protein [Xanthobacteraceae bacterium]
MLKLAITATALALLTASPALAQSGGFVQKQGANEWRSSKLVGTNVYGPADEKIGDINEVLIDNKGGVHAVVIGVGGFLGVGEKDVAVPFKSLNIKRAENSDKIDRISVRYTKDQLKQAPAFKFYEAANTRSERNTTGTGRAPAEPPPSTTPANPAPRR